MELADRNFVRDYSKTEKWVNSVNLMEIERKNVKFRNEGEIQWEKIEFYGKYGI